MKCLWRCSIGGRAIDLEIPLLQTTFYLFDDIESGVKATFLDLSGRFGGRDLFQRHSQVGSLAGAAHLLKDNAGVLR